MLSFWPLLQNFIWQWSEIFVDLGFPYILTGGPCALWRPVQALKLSWTYIITTINFQDIEE